jgi:hypothetical protein
VAAVESIERIRWRLSALVPVSIAGSMKKEMFSGSYQHERGAWIRL